MTQEYLVRCITIYFEILHGYKRFCCIPNTAGTNSTYYGMLPSQTHFNNVGDYIALNYTFMTLRVGIYQGAVVFYRDLTRKTVSDIRSEWFGHHSSRKNIRKNDTGITGTMHYDIFSRITRLQTVLLHSIHCKHQFRILQYIIFVYTN